MLLGWAGTGTGRGVQGCACGLLYLHCQVPPVVHRDVKPENFLMSAAGEVKVGPHCKVYWPKVQLSTLYYSAGEVKLGPQCLRREDPQDDEGGSTVKLPSGVRKIIAQC